MKLPLGDRSLVRPFTHRRRKNTLRCEKCGATIDNGATAYKESLPAAEHRFLTGIIWCAKCVTGGGQ